MLIPIYAGQLRKAFYQLRASKVVAEHHIAINGTLKQDSSSVNDLSAFSYKAKKKGCQEVSVLYAYDIEAMEPICAEVFPGNWIFLPTESSPPTNWKSGFRYPESALLCLH